MWLAVRPGTDAGRLYSDDIVWLGVWIVRHAAMSHAVHAPAETVAGGVLCSGGKGEWYADGDGVCAEVVTAAVV